MVPILKGDCLPSEVIKNDFPEVEKLPVLFEYTFPGAGSNYTYRTGKQKYP